MLLSTTANGVEREFEDCNARGHPLPPYLVAWVQVKRLADEADSRREFLPQDPSEYAYFRHIPYSIASPYEATAIAPRKSAQTPQFHAKSATPLGSISSNKTVPRPSFHPSLWEAETGGAEMVRGNGDNKVHHGTRINKKNSYNGDAGSLNEAGKRINGAPGSDKGRVAKSSKRLHTVSSKELGLILVMLTCDQGRISNYVVQNEKHNRFVASQGKPITKEALDAGFAGTKDRERYEKHLQKNRNHARSRGIHYAPSSGYYQNYPGYGGLYSPSSQLPTTSNPGPPMFDVAHPFPSSQNLTGHAVFQSPGANFLQSPPNQFLQFNQFYPRNNVVAQVQVQQGTPIPPNEYAQNQPVLDKYGLSHSHPTGAHAPYLHSPPNRH